MENKENDKIIEEKIKNCTEDKLKVQIENACDCNGDENSDKCICGDDCGCHDFSEEDECFCGDCSCIETIVEENIINTEEICDCNCLTNPLNVAEKTCDCECPQNFNIFD